MRVLVCVRQGLDGEISPFDACAYEAALRIEGAEVILLSMGPLTAKDFLLNLTRLGASEAYLLSDRAFAGADTLATAYTLSLAVKRLSPDLVLTGRQTMIGDTGQTGPMLSVLANLSLATGVLRLSVKDDCVICETRGEGAVTLDMPALLTVERIHTLRLPRLRSKVGSVTVWTAEELSADTSRCGLVGSPTRVLRSFENQSGRRRCKKITPAELDGAIREGIAKSASMLQESEKSAERLPHVIAVGGDAVRRFADTVSDRVTLLPLGDMQTLAEQIDALAPSAVLFGSDAEGKRLSAQIAAMKGLGLCADCTSLGVEGGTLLMYRPALAGSVIACVRSLTPPAMATVRTEEACGSLVTVAAGYGVRNSLDEVRALADRYGASLASTRKMVDHGYLPYDMQIGLTGRTISPAVYIALGISGAVHHIVGMQRSGTVIAVNPDKDAPIFDYADFGIVADFDTIKSMI